MNPAPEGIDAILSAGNALEDEGDVEGAMVHYLRAAELAPGHPRPLLNLSNALVLLGRLPEAEVRIRAAIVLAPTYAPGHFNLGRMKMVSDPLGAIDAFRRALTCDPHFNDARVCLASLASESGDDAESLRLLREAVADNALHPGALVALSAQLAECEAFDEGENFARRVLANDPTSVPALLQLAHTLFATRRLRESADCHLKVLELDPLNIASASAICFNLLARDDLDYRDILGLQRKVMLPFEQAIPSDFQFVEGTGRVRVGYLSPDFHNQVVALFIEPILRHHDRTRFEVFCYYTSPVTDQITKVLRDLTEHWRDVSGMDEAQAISTVRSDRLDILVDLAGHTANGSPRIFIRRCANAQFTWLGYLGSTGIANMDYRLCDPVTDPEKHADIVGTEKPVRLPVTQWCYAPLHWLGDSPLTPRPAGTGLRFGSFNQFWKISPAAVRLWASVMRDQPQSTLLVQGAPHGRASERLVEEFTAQGVSANRIELRPRAPVADYFAAYGEVDVALDTTPYSGATTTLDALWSGVPVVTLTGDRPVAQSSASILRAAGLHELVAESEADFISACARLEARQSRLLHYKATLRPTMATTALMDARGFTRDLESRFLQVLPLGRMADA